MTPKQKAAMQAALRLAESIARPTSRGSWNPTTIQLREHCDVLRAALAEPAVEHVKLWCETCEDAGKVYQEHQDGCWAGGHHTCPDCGGKGYDFTSPPPASEPADHVSNNGRGYPWERDGVLTPIYSPQQLDEVIEGSAAAHYASWDSSIPSPTEGMNIVKRIHHVGGRNNAAGFVEFGSIQAVQALVRQVLRDLPPEAIRVAAVDRR